MELFDLLAGTLRDQAIPETKIGFIVEGLRNALPNGNGNHIWQSFCKGCLEMNIDPHAVMISALDHSPGAAFVFENLDLESY